MVGAGVITVAPRVALRAIADGAVRTDGVWSVAEDPASGRMVALIGTGAGPVVRELEESRDGLVRMGAPIGVSLGGVDAIAITIADRRFGLLGTERSVRRPRPQRPPAPTVFDPLLADEPDPPSASIAADPHDPVGVRVDIAGGTVAATPGIGLVTAALGSWSIRQHGTDDEADHLSELTADRHGRPAFTIGGLDQAGLATVAGTETAPVLSVADGRGAIRVLPLGGGSAPDLADRPSTIVTRTGSSVVAADVDGAGRLIVAELDGAGWAPWRTVPGLQGITSLLPITGSHQVLATVSRGTVRIDPGAR